MKYTPIVFACVALLLMACGSEGTTETATPGKKEAITITNRSWYALDAENSTVTWDRKLDQKATTKKVKLFGNWVDVELGPVQLETNGNVQLEEGIITTENDELNDGALVFNMAAFNFNDEENGGLFKVREFPRSRFVINSFSPDSANRYTLDGNLTLQDSTQNMSFPVVVEQAADGMTMNGQFVLHTLDWPLRDAAAREIVNTDDITITMDLVFKPDSAASDTTIVLE